MKSNYHMEKVMEYTKPFLMAVFTFLTPINGLLGLLFLAVLIDTLFAIYTAVKQRGWSSFQSVILRKGIGAKLLFYLGTVILAFLIDKYIIGASAFRIPYLLSKAISSIWIYVEVKSIDETSMKMGNRSIWVIIREMIQKLANLKKEIDDTCDKPKNS